nr:hypothetical protein [Micromonospora sp. DSM 115978]
MSQGRVAPRTAAAPGPSAETTAHVLRIADRLGYRTSRTASLLARRRSGMLGVTVTRSDPFHAEMVEEIQLVADRGGHDLALVAVTPAHDETQAIEPHLVVRGSTATAPAAD